MPKTIISDTSCFIVLSNIKEQDIILSIKQILEKIKTTDFRLSYEIEIQALKAAGE